MAIYKDIIGGSMNKNLDKHYDPKKFENRIYKAWMDADAFKAKVDTKNNCGISGI